MIAVDTNVLVRLVTADDEGQTRRATALFEREEVFLCKTVLLETEWVLRFSYGLDGPAILRALRGVAGLPGVTVEDAPAVVLAFALMEDGVDFADALHLASARKAAGFATFARRLARHAAVAEEGWVLEV